jgi:hypothetical protein
VGEAHLRRIVGAVAGYRKMNREFIDRWTRIAPLHRAIEHLGGYHVTTCS